jgi:hypothetical protein
MNKINRRTAIGVVGSVFGSSLLLGNQSLMGLDKSCNDVIATGFPIIDQSFNGGLRRGELYCTIGDEKSGKSLFNESVAYNASKKCLVAVYNLNKIGIRHTRVTYVSNIFTYERMLSSIEHAAEFYDLFVLELPLMIFDESYIFVKQLLRIAQTRQVVILTQYTTNGFDVLPLKVSSFLACASSGIWSLKEDSTLGKPLCESLPYHTPAFRIKIKKNRRLMHRNSAILDMVGDPTLMLKERVS